MDSYCSLLWTHLCVQPEGRLRPCCQYQGDLVQKEGEALMESFQKGDVFQSLRSRSQNGQAITGCQKCYDEEKFEGSSYRTLSNQQFPIIEDLGLQSSAKNVRHIELFIGNKCNLKCLICHPRNSTKWEQDYTKLNWDFQPIRTPVPDLPWSDFANLKSLKILGGEPFLYSDHWRTLQAIPLSVRQQVDLNYFSNATFLPSSDLKDIWQDFKSVRVSLSIDGYGALNDYMRYPSRWKDIEQVTQELLKLSGLRDNFHLNLHATVSLLNYLKINDLVSWYKSLVNTITPNKRAECTLCLLREPEHLAPTNLSQHLIEKALQDLGDKEPEVQEFIGWTSRVPRQDHLDQTRNYLKQIDSIRDLKLADVSPELHTFLWPDAPSSRPHCTDSIQS